MHCLSPKLSSLVPALGVWTHLMLAGAGMSAAECGFPESTLREEGSPTVHETAALLAEARESGSVKIIVRLKVPGMPENAAATSGNGDLEQRIGAAADCVLKGVSGTRHRVYRRYTSLPLIALEASPEAIETLAALPCVADVRKDTARLLK